LIDLCYILFYGWRDGDEFPEYLFINPLYTNEIATS
jgi:hypothetical protein